MRYLVSILLITLTACSHPGFYVKKDSCKENAPGWLLCDEVKGAD